MTTKPPRPLKGLRPGSYLVVSQREREHWKQELEEEHEDGVHGSSSFRHGLGARLELAQLVHDDLLEYERGL